MATIGVIDIKMKVEREEWTKGLAQAGSQLRGFAGQLAPAASKARAFAQEMSGFNAIKGTLGGMVAALGASAVVGSLVAMTKHSMEFIGETRKVAHRIGSTVLAFSQLSYAVKRTGTDVELLEPALLKMNKNLGLAAAGGKEPAAAFRKIGLDAKKLVMQDPAAAFIDIAGAISKLPNPAEKAAAAVGIFGKAGAMLLNTLGTSPEKLAQLGAEATRMGQAFNDVEADKVLAANVALAQIWRTIDGLANKLAIALAPGIQMCAEKFLALGENGQTAGEKVVMGLKPIAVGLGFLGDVVVAFKLMFRAALFAVTAPVAVIMKLFEKFANLMGKINGFFGGENKPAAWVKDASDAVHEFTQGNLDAMRETFEAPLPSKNVGDFFDELASGAKEAENAVGGAGKAVTGLSDDVIDMAGKIADLTEKLQEQKDTFGMTGGDLEIYKLGLKGATFEQLKEVSAISSAINEMERKQKANDKLYEDAQKTKEESKTAVEKLATEKENLTKQFAAGLINQKQFDAALEKAKQSAGLGDFEKRAGAIELGSKEARTSIMENAGRKADDPSKNIEKNTSESVTVQRQMMGALGAIRDRIAGVGAPPAFDF